MTLPVAFGIVAFGAVVGVLSGLFGIGGGIAMVPFMVLLLDRTQHLAEGTSLLVIIPTAIAGVVAHHKRGYVSFRHGGVLAIGGVFGAFIGARLALSIDQEMLQRVFAIFLVFMGARVIHDGRRTGRRAADA